MPLFTNKKIEPLQTKDTVLEGLVFIDEHFIILKDQSYNESFYAAKALAMADAAKTARHDGTATAINYITPKHYAMARPIYKQFANNAKKQT